MHIPLTMKTTQLLSAAVILSQQCISISAKQSLRRRQSQTTTSAAAADEPLLSIEQRELDTRIIGGTEATEDRHSYAVSLSDDIGHFCGGSLIAPDVVLTAAHCQGGAYDVIVGRHDVDDNDGEVIKTKYDKPHPNYNPSTTDQDFMLVFLLSPVSVTNVDLVKLNKDNNYPSVGEEVTVMGWGDTNIQDSVSDLSDVLMHVDVNVISNNECDDSEGYVSGYFDSYNGQITNNMLCARKVGGGEDSCQGDSGGPLVVKGGSASQDVQVGVVSWGVGCASEHFPGVYARVSKSYDWIEQEVCKGSNYASEASFDCGNVSTSSSGGGVIDDDEDDYYTPPSSGGGGSTTDDDMTNYFYDLLGGK